METIRILITGPPRCGKTTLIRRVAAALTIPYTGFFTEEVLKDGRRVGFQIESFDGKKAMMSHIDFRSRYRVGHYGVDIGNLERIALPVMKEALRLKRLPLIDEIGKMELCSEGFKDLLLQLFDSNVPLLATILFKPHPFCDRLKNSPGVTLMMLSKDNRERFFECIMGKLTRSR